MLTKIGIGSLIAGVFMAIFAGISGLMEKKNFWVDLTLSKIFGEETTESFITFTSSETIQNVLDSFMYEVPVSIIALATGLICLVFGLFVKDF
ncbi:MAG: hypothetical protein KKE62_15695 [Proteobacteria bacterium]|nr:hypothetical protein [Pseudomonadota bacterium]MBU1387292.1 hypothetical protein [Pseudomonadota bacterium]MBU1544274.1 hypothetical protein [Pseudomonadota bacterium]